MSSKLASGSLQSGLLAAGTIPRRPRPQNTQAPREALAEKGRLGFSTELLSIFKGAYVGVQVAEVHLGIGVDFLAVSVGE